jgi:catechol 2,3-dioxygenase-like lactoylglutathione lyase family enzyme
MKLEHVAINVPDAQAFVKFFVDNLGMRVVLSNNSAPFMHFIADEEGSMLEIYSNTTVPMPDYPSMHPQNLHLAFSSNDIEADRARLLAAGAEAFGEIINTPAGDKLAFFRGPQSVPFQLVQRKNPLV